MNELNYSEVIRVNNKVEVITTVHRKFLQHCNPSINEIDLIEFINITLNKEYNTIILNAVLLSLFNSGNLDIKNGDGNTLEFRTVGSRYVSITDKHMNISIDEILVDNVLRNKIYDIIYDRAMLDMLSVKLDKPMISRK